MVCFKWHIPWIGPFTVQRSLPNNVYEIVSERLGQTRSITVHFNRLKPDGSSIRDDPITYYSQFSDTPIGMQGSLDGKPIALWAVQLFEMEGGSYSPRN